MFSKISAAVTALAVVMSLCSCSNADYTSDGGEITTAEITSFTTTAASSESINSEETEALIAAETQNTIIDREGNEITIPDEINTIVSTAPSVTEILCGLGLGSKIAAADTYSADVEGIDKSVCTLDMEKLDAEAIIALSPDAVIINGISDNGVNDGITSLKNAGINVVFIPTSTSLAGIKLDIEFLAAYTGEADKGKEMTDEIDKAIADISAKAAGITEKKKVYFEVSAAPYLYSCGKGTFADEIINLCGGENIYASQDGWLSNSDESVIEGNPDVIITSVMYDGYDYKEILAREGWDVIPAVKNNEVYQVDSNAVSRPSQNIVKGMYEIARAVYPDVYAE